MAENKYDYKKAPVLSKVKIGGTPYFLKDAEARDAIDSILADYLKSGDKTELQGLITALTGRVTTIEGTYATDTELANAIAQEVSDRNAAILVETNRAKDAEQGLQNAIDALAADAAKVAEGEKIISKNSNHELQTTLNISIEKISDVEYIVLRGVGGKEVTKVDATDFVKDGMIENVELVTEGGKTLLRITFNTAAGGKVIDVDVTTLIDIYTAGKGLELTGNKFDVKIDPASEGFLTVSVNGVKLDGVQEAINIAREAAKTYADGLNTAMGARVAVFEAGGAHDVAALETKVDGIDSAYKAADTALGNRIKVYEANKADYDDAVSKAHTHSNKTVLDGIDAQKVANWQNEVGAKAAIGTKEDASGAETVYGQMKAGDAASELAAKTYTDGAVAPKADKTYVDTELENKVDKVTGKSLIDDTEITRLAGIETGAQVNKIEKVKLNGEYVTISNKEIDLGAVASDARVKDLEDEFAAGGRVTAAEADIDALEGQMAVVQGADTVEGSIAKAKKDAIAAATEAAKGYTDTEVEKVADDLTALRGDFADHTHSVTASGKITPSLNTSEKHLGVSTTNSDEFVKDFSAPTQGLVVAQYVNSVGKVAKSVSDWTIAPDATDSECLVFTPTTVSWDGVGDVGRADAATGALSTDDGLVQVVTGVSATSKGTALKTVSLTNEGNTGVAYIESVNGVEQDVNVSGTAAIVSK